MSRGTAKGAQYARSLDQARRQGLWTDKFPVDAKGRVRTSIVTASTLTVPGVTTPASPGGSANGSTAADAEQLAVGIDWADLVRKYSKHNPGKGAAATIALAEHGLHNLVQQDKEKSQFFSDKVHAADFPLRSFPLPDGKTSRTRWPDKYDNSTREIQDARRKLEPIPTSSQASENEKNSAYIILAWTHYLTGNYTMTLDLLRDVDISLVGLEKAATDTDLETEGHDVGLVVFGALLKAQALERSGDKKNAPRAYNTARRVYEAAVEVVQGESNAQLTDWGEQILYRNAILARSSSDVAAARDAHKVYFQHAEDLWPSNFRLHKRASVYRSYLWLHLEPQTSEKNGAPSVGSANSGSTRQGDADELYALERAYENVLKQVTTFPKAGHVNRLVLDFADTVVYGWKAGGERRDEIDGVLEFLYAATAQTFQSQRIMRHLSYVLTAYGSYDEARRALAIYYALWTKAQEADISHVNEQTKESEKRAAEAEEKERKKSDDADPSGKGEEMDDTKTFIETIVWGVRLLCKFLTDEVQIEDGPRKAEQYAKKAGEVVKDVKDERERQRLEAAVERAKGTAQFFISKKEADPQTRPAQQSAALEHLTKSVEIDPSYLNLYHLAYVQAQLREISAADSTARKAVEINPDSREAWHLLALVVSASEGKDLEGSLKVLDAVIDRDDDDEDGWVNVGNADGEQDEFGVVKVGEPKAKRERRLEDIEAAMQLRMTRNAVVEALQGAEAALVDQQSNLFSFYAKVKDALKMLSVGASETGNAIAELDKQDDDADEKTLGSPAPPNGIGKGLPSTTLERYAASARGASGSNLNVSTPKRKASAAPSFSGRSLVSVRSNRSRVASMMPRSGSISSPAAVTGGRGRSMSSAFEVNGIVEPARTTPVDRRAKKLLVSLWLMSAATFRRAGRLDEARTAIQEAEDIDAEDPDVWLQFALYNFAIGNGTLAVTSLSKALSFDQDHVPSLVHLARSFLAPKVGEGPRPQPELAESLMTLLTQTNGWDVPEAWFVLAQAYEADRPTSKARQDRSRECLIYALQLEETNPVRPWNTAIPECL